MRLELQFVNKEGFFLIWLTVEQGMFLNKYVAEITHKNEVQTVYGKLLRFFSLLFSVAVFLCLKENK